MPADRPRRSDAPDDDNRLWGDGRPVVRYAIGAGGLFAILLETAVLAFMLLARCDAVR